MTIELKKNYLFLAVLRLRCGVKTFLPIAVASSAVKRRFRAHRPQ